MPAESAIGWDLGGAHLKAARLNRSGGVERVMQVPCPLWQGLPHLHAALEQVLPLLGEAALHAVTMTGEMVDFFRDRAEGVTQLVDAMERRFPGSRLTFYAGEKGFVKGGQVGDAIGQIASANWRASAQLVAARLPEALLVDIGSTTTDLIPIREGVVRAQGRDDASRLVAGELVYTGVVRTPVMALVERVPFDGEWSPLIAELFATSADVHRLTGRLPESADQHAAADGGEKTVVGSARRLARMIGRDLDAAPLEAWRHLATWLAGIQARRIEDACVRLRSRERFEVGVPLVAAGVGRFLVEEVAKRLGLPCLGFGRLLPESAEPPDRIGDCAPAVAVAWLGLRAMERNPSAPAGRPRVSPQPKAAPGRVGGDHD
jgi:probable H4MPT-linked C1 transfer pathway protein